MQKISEVKNDIESLQDSIKKLANSSLQYINDNIELKEKVLLYDEIISKAIGEKDETLKKILKSAGLITSDGRQVEIKKP